jgi:hypothetical protein
MDILLYPKEEKLTSEYLLKVIAGIGLFGSFASLTSLLLRIWSGK